MGYRSNFHLTAKSESLDELYEIEDYLDRYRDNFYGLNLYEEGCDIFDETLEVGMSESVKWYSYHEDMRDLSLEFPYALFILDIAGEEPGDMRRAFYVNGAFYEADYVAPEFDIERLR